jgi:hypothetical protein
LEVIHSDLDQIAIVVVVRNPVVAGQVHTGLQGVIDPTLCGSAGLVGLEMWIGSSEELATKRFRMSMS